MKNHTGKDKKCNCSLSRGGKWILTCIGCIALLVATMDILTQKLIKSIRTDDDNDRWGIDHSLTMWHERLQR